MDESSNKKTHEFNNKFSKVDNVIKKYDSLLDEDNKLKSSKFGDRQIENKNNITLKYN